jgi:hypothetical protein
LKSFPQKETKRISGKIYCQPCKQALETQMTEWLARHRGQSYTAVVVTPTKPDDKPRKKPPTRGPGSQDQNEKFQALYRTKGAGSDS